MSMFTVDEKCIRCGLCAELCPARIIKMEDGAPFVAEENERKCIRCGQCVSFCPKSCCYLGFQEERVPVDASLFPSAESAETLLRSRRSVRKFKSDAVPEDTVRRLIETARYAPTAENLQPVRWVVAMKREKLAEFGDVMADFFEEQANANPDDGHAQFGEALAGAWRKGRDIFFRGAPQLAVALVKKTHPFPEDGAIALTYFELAAHALGVGCTWGGFFTLVGRKCAKLTDLVGMRDDELLEGAQMFGYPQDGLRLSHLLPPRKKPDISFL